MSEFDLDGYFANKDLALATEDPAAFNSLAGTADNKRAESEARAQKKLESLNALKRQREASEKAYEDSWVGKAGLDPDGVAGSVTNLGASIASGTTRIAGDLVTLAPDLMTGAQDILTPDAVTEAYNRKQVGESTEADELLLNQTGFEPTSGTEITNGVYTGEKIDAPTWNERFASSQSKREWAADTSDSFDFSSIIEPSKRAGLSDDLASGSSKGLSNLKSALKAYDDGEMLTAVADGVSGLASLLVNAGDAVLRNPGAVAEYAAEMLPQLAAARIGLLTPQVAGYAAEVYRDGVLRYQELNNGQLPPDAEQFSMAAHAASLFLAEKIGLESVGKQVGAIKRAAGAAKKDTAGLPGIAKAGVVGGAGEGTTETWQTYAEGQAGYDPATPGEIYEGGVIGTAVGASLAVPGKTVQEIKRASKEQTDVTETQATQTAEATEAVEEAVETGDISKYTDPRDMDNYDLKTAVDVAEKRYAKDSTDVKTKEQIDSLVQQTDRDLFAARNAASDTQLDGFKQTLADAKETLETGTDPDKKANAEKVIATFPPMIANMEKQRDPKNAQKLQADVIRLEAIATRAQTLQESYVSEDVASGETSVTDLKVEAGIQEATTDTSLTDADVAPTVAPETKAKAAQTLTTQSMKSPDVLNMVEANRLVEDTSNGLSEGQRDYLRGFAKSQELQEGVRKGWKNTQSDIMKGRDGFRGIPQYRALINTALGAKDTEGVNGYLDNLRSFARDHQAKARQVKKAYDGFTLDGKERQVLRGKEPGSWSINTGKLLKQTALTANGGVFVNEKTSTLARNIGLESEALNAAGIEMTAMVNANAPTATPQPKQAKPNVKQATKPETKPKQTTPTAAKKPAAPAPKPASGKPTAEVTAAPMNVWAGTGENAALSNLAPRQFTHTDGNKYYSVEHAYQSLKSGEFDATTYSKYKQGKQQKIVGKKGTKTVDGWNIELMAELIQESFAQNDSAAKALLATGNQQITHNQDKGVWAKEFPRLLMETRKALGKPNTPTVQAPVETDFTDDGSGKLDQFMPKTDKTKQAPVTNDNYRDVDLLERLYVQDEGKDTVDGGMKPLVTKKNFLSELAETPDVGHTFTSDQTHLPEEIQISQDGVLAKFANTAKGWMPQLKELTQQKKGHKAEDDHYTIFNAFVDKQTGAIENENVLTAIAFAAWSYLGDSATDPLQAEDSAIRKTMGKGPSYVLQPEDKMAYQLAGERATMLQVSVGLKGSQALGLKARNDAPEGTQSRLDAMLGAYALALLSDLGYIERHRVEHEGEGKRGAAFIRLVRNRNTKEMLPLNDVVEIGKASRGNQSYLDTMFGSEPTIVEPFFTKQEFTQKTAKGHKNRIPENHRETQQEQLDKTWEPRTGINDLWTHLDEDQKADVVGVVDTSKVHKSQRDSIAATNEGKLREIRLYEEFINDHMGSDMSRKFHLLPDVWVQHRVGIKSTINPQNSKFVREMIGMSGWKGDISTSRSSKYNRLFRQNVAMGFGIKADKKYLKNTLKELDTVLAEPVIRAALDAIKTQITTGEMPVGGGDLLIAAVKRGDENTHTLSVLHAYAMYENASDNKEKTFNPDMMMMEVDGVTNGPMLTMLLLGAANTVPGLFKFLNKGGFFEKGSIYKNYVDHKEAKEPDLYETTVTEVIKGLLKTVKGNAKKTGVLSTIGFFKGDNSFVPGGQMFNQDSETGDIKVGGVGRNFIKTPLTGMMFGQSVKGGVKSMADELVDDMYSLVTNFNLQDPIQYEMDEFASQWVTNVNTMITGLFPNNENGTNSRDKLKLNKNMKYSEIMDFEFSKEQLTAIKQAFTGIKDHEDGTVGQAVENAMESMYSVFLERRSVLNQAAQASSLLYKEIYDYKIEKERERQIASGELAHNVSRKGENFALVDLKPASKKVIADSLSKLSPTMHTGMSRLDNDLDAGLFLPTESKRLDAENSMYRQDVRFGKQVPHNEGEFSTNTKPDYQTSKAPGYQDLLSDPGIRSLILAVHSVDAAISALAYKQLDALNIHDANGLSVADIVQGARNLNEATYLVMLKFSLPLEMKATLDRTVDGIHELMDDVQDSPELQQRLRNVIDGVYEDVVTSAGDTYKKQVFGIRLNANQTEHLDILKAGGSNLNTLSYLLQQVNEVAYTSETTKLSAMIDMVYLDQYAQAPVEKGDQGGAYIVSDEMRKAAVDRRTEVLAEQYGGLSTDGKKRSNTTVVKNLWKAQQIEWTIKGSRGLMPNEGVPLVVPKPAAPTTDRSNAELAAGLRDAVARTEANLTRQFKQNGSVSDIDKGTFRKLTLLADAITRKGSLDAALETVYPGESNVKTRANTGNWIKTITRDNPKALPPSVTDMGYQALNVMDLIAADMDMDADLQSRLVPVQAYMKEHHVLLGEALRNTVSPAQAATVVDSLDTYYNGSRLTPWGVLGEAINSPDTELESFLSSTPNLKASQLIDHLEEGLKTSKSNNDRFYRMMLKLVRKSVPGDLPIRYITRDTAPTGLPEGSVTRSRAWYEPDAGNEHIGIKSSDFIHSMVQPEVVIHELVHRALAGLIDQGQNNPKSDAAKTVAELEALMASVETYLNQEGNESLKSQSVDAMENLHEFVTWGMTNFEFQKNVLNVVEVQDTTSAEALQSGWKAFAKKVVKLLIGTLPVSQKTADGMTTAFEALVTNATGLFHMASQSSTKTLKGSTLHNRSTDPFNTVKDYTTKQVFEEVGKRQATTHDAEYTDHLKTVLGTIVDKIHGPYGTFKNQVADRANYSSEDRFIEALMGNMPFVSKVIGQPIGISDQEAFVIEQVEASMMASLDSSSIAYRELGKLFRETKANLKPQDFYPGDWTQATYEEKQQAKNVYSLIFKPQATADGKSNYLTQFAAMGLAYKPLRDLMQVPTARTDTGLRGKKLGDMLLTLFRQLMNTVSGKLTQTFGGQNADAKLDALMNQLVNIEAKRRTQLARNKSTVVTALSGAIESANEGMRDRVDTLGKSKFFTEAKTSLVRAAGVTMRVVAKDRADAVFSVLQDVRNKMFRNRQGMLSAVVTEIRGANDTNAVAYGLLRGANKHEQERKAVDEHVQDSILTSFEGEGKYLTDADKAAITRLNLRTDMVELRKEYSMDELIQLVRNPKTLATAIQKYETLVYGSGKHRHYWVRGAKDMGYYMATNINRNENLMMNARNLAEMYGTSKAGTLSKTKVDEVTQYLDPLISLYAIQHTSTADKKTGAAVMTRENQRGDQSGVEMVMRLHEKLKNDAKKALFSDESVHFVKGYTWEITNPYREVVMADGVDAENLLAMGATKGPVLERDPIDPDQVKKTLFVIEDGGKKSWVTGVFSNTGKGTSGSLLHGGLSRADNAGFTSTANTATNATVAGKLSKGIENMFLPDSGYNPSTQTNKRMVPLLNERGSVVNYRYMMEASVRDAENILGRNNKMDEVLGAMSANLVDKVNTERSNSEAIKALHDQYKADGHSNPERYLKVSADSNDPTIREAYRLLPDDTRKEIVSVWGSSSLMVPVDQYNMFFGYRKKSLTDGFSKDPDERKVREELFITVMEVFMGKKAALRIRRAENVWMEIVTMIKDFVVIKNLFTLVDNIGSNVSELLLAGVPLGSIVKTHRVAIEGVLAYQKDLKELQHLELMKELKRTDGLGDVDSRITELKDGIQRNPVNELIEAGLFQTIVEDVDAEENGYNYKSKLTRFTDSKTQWIPKVAKDVAKFAVVAHDTKLYKMLYQTTHMSDFVARYTLYEHVTKREKNQLSKEEAIQYVEDAFVNYDVPTHRFIQYLNDTGLVMFTKYYIRIQKFLFRLYRENPARALALVLFSDMFKNIPTIIDSGFWNRSSNPFSAGAIGLPGAAEEAIPTNIVMNFMR